MITKLLSLFLSIAISMSFTSISWADKQSFSRVNNHYGFHDDDRDDSHKTHDRDHHDGHEHHSSRGRGRAALFAIGGIIGGVAIGKAVNHYIHDHNEENDSISFTNNVLSIDNVHYSFWPTFYPESNTTGFEFSIKY